MKSATHPARRALRLFEPTAESIYSIETAAQCGHVSRRRILIYYKHGLLSPRIDPDSGGYFFDAETIQTLRQIERLRAFCGDDLVGIGIILRLANEVDELRKEVRRLRERVKGNARAG